MLSRIRPKQPQGAMITGPVALCKPPKVGMWLLVYQAD